LAVPLGEGPDAVTVTLRVDQTFSVAGDMRKLGVVVAKIGFAKVFSHITTSLNTP